MRFITFSFRGVKSGLLGSEREAILARETPIRQPELREVERRAALNWARPVDGNGDA
jgi:hypothetical protein